MGSKYERLSKARKSLGMTQQQIASATNVSLRAYARYESGEGGREIPSTVLDFYAQNGVNINWLLTGEGPVLLSSPDRVASESPEDKESSLAANALRDDILAQKIVLMLQGVDEEGRREILANAEKIKQAAEERARLVELEAQVEVLKGLVGKRAG